MYLIKDTDFQAMRRGVSNADSRDYMWVGVHGPECGAQGTFPVPLSAAEDPLSAGLKMMRVQVGYMYT